MITLDSDGWCKKDETLKKQPNLLKLLQNEKNLTVIKIRSDQWTEFLNKAITAFCDYNGILHKFASASTPQKNGVAERWNRSIKEAARIMLAEAKLPERYWVETFNTTRHTQNRSMINKKLNKTSSEVWNGGKPKQVVILNHKHHLRAYQKRKSIQDKLLCA